MKKLLLTLSLGLFGLTAAVAQDMGQPQDAVESQTEQLGAPDADIDQSGREQLDEASLPAAVSEALRADAYATMIVSEVYKISDATSDLGEAAYEVHLQSEDGLNTVVKFNEDGQILESEDIQY